MKKLIAILLVVFLAFAYAGDGINDFKTNAGASLTPASGDRLHFLDVSTIGTAKGQEYVTWSWLVDKVGDELGEMVVLDTSNVLAEGNGSGTYSISLLSTQLLLIDFLYVGSGADSGDYYELATDDSNGTALDTINLVTSGRRSNVYFFNPTQDTTLYVVRGDTMSVNPNMVIRKMVVTK